LPRALHAGLHLDQHTTHVWVLDDVDLGRVGVLEVLDAGALLAVLGVVRRVEIRGRSTGQPLQTDADTGAVHHQEHLGHALVLLCAHQLTDTGVVVAEVDHAGGRAIDAHLVLDGRHGDVVVGAVEPLTRDDEQRQALGARLGAFDAREHQVDHVLGHVVVAARDEDLGAADTVGAVRVLLGSRGGRADVAAGVHMVPPHLPTNILDEYFSCCSGVPTCAITSAAPMVRPGYIENAVLAPLIISSTHSCTTCGAPWPPWSASSAMPFQPFS
jgi:hypothetical protein